MNLADALAADLAGILSDLGEMREIAVAMGHLAPHLANKATDLMQRGMSATARVNGMKATVAAARMIGAMEPKTVPVPVEDLPLFAPRDVPPVNLPAVLRSLHRANDHSLDPDSIH